MADPSAHRRANGVVVAVLVTVVAMGACSGMPASRPTPGGSSMPTGSSTTGAGGDVSGEVLVSAASSLTDAFGAIEAAVEDEHPDLDVVLNLAGSSALREQVLAGAPVDVFASANTDNMDRVVAAGAVAGDPHVFTTNRLQIAVPPANPAGVRSLADFADQDLLLGLCAVEVPCGDFARRALAAAGVDPAVDTDEPDVRALLTKIEVAELDAGITYVTDVTAAAGAVEGVEIPEQDNVVATYPLAVLAAAPNPDAAQVFVDFVLSPRGQDLLASAGFTSP